MWHAGMEILQFKVMSKMIERVQKWTANELPLLSTAMSSHGSQSSLEKQLSGVRILLLPS